MKIIRVEKTVSCAECGAAKELLQCVLFDIGVRDEFYCNDCLNKFEDDEENYKVLS